jgi:regulator of replication initiation timing
MYNWFNYSRVKKQLESQLAENAALREENKNLEDILKSIEQDGTEEHNNAVALRQEIAFLKAKYQVISNDYKKCAEERDKYKHQLNAANKEIEVLKSKLKT